MRSTTIRPVLLVFIALILLGLTSCPASTPNPADTDPNWTFDSDEDGWETVLYDTSFMSRNGDATVSWSATEGAPGVGSLQVEVPFEGANEYVTVIAPITPDPLSSGTDLTGKKFSARVKSAAAFSGYAMVFSNSGPSPDFPYGDGVPVALNTDWLTVELDLTQVLNPDYVPSDMRFLGVMFYTGGTDPPDATYTFYVDTAVIEDAL